MDRRTEGSELMVEHSALSFDRQLPLPNIPHSRSYVSMSSVNEGEGPPLRQLLVAVDDSPASLKALKWALENLYRRGDVLSLVTVIPEPAPLHSWSGVYTPPNDEQEAQEIAEAKEMVLRTFVPLLMEHRSRFRLHIVVASVDSSTVSHVIREEADVIGAAAVILGSHNKSILQEAWLGSVTKACVKNCLSNPLVIVH